MVAPKSTPNFGDVKIALTIVDISRKIAKTHNYKHMSFYDCSFTQRFPSRPLRKEPQVLDLWLFCVREEEVRTSRVRNRFSALRSKESRPSSPTTLQDLLAGSLAYCLRHYAHLCESEVRGHPIKIFLLSPILRQHCYTFAEKLRYK